MPPIWHLAIKTYDSLLIIQKFTRNNPIYKTDTLIIKTQRNNPRNTKNITFNHHFDLNMMNEVLNDNIKCIITFFLTFSYRRIYGDVSFHIIKEIS